MARPLGRPRRAGYADMFPVGSQVTARQLEQDPYAAIAQLRVSEPVSWLPALGGWFITRRDLGLHAMRDAETFTVDDPRFTTAAVLGPSMLSLDGSEHERHRLPFAPAFRPAVVRDEFDDFLGREARRLIGEFKQRGHAELRTALAGPLAVNTIAKFLGLGDVAPDEILGWYYRIAKAIVDLTVGDEIAEEDTHAIRGIHRRVNETLEAGDSTSLLHQIKANGLLQPEEMSSSAVVIMFGAIETAEGMTANALFHLLSHPDVLARVVEDPALVPFVVEESLRLEPAAAVIDRYTTRDVELAGVTIPKGDLVTISLLGANRDPEVFTDPDSFNIDRPNSRQHVTFVQGPHGCLGLHLARLETTIAVHAVLDELPGIALDPATTAPAGLIFRKPDRLMARWR